MLFADKVFGSFIFPILSGRTVALRSRIILPSTLRSSRLSLCFCSYNLNFVNNFLSSYMLFTDEVFRYLICPNPSSRTMALRPTQPLTEMSTRNLPAGKQLPTLKADNLAAVYESIF
jgi:hypothetical protein